MRGVLIASFLIALSFLGGCSRNGTGDEEGDGHMVHWGYGRDDGPTRWGSMAPKWRLCGEGRAQSPVDLGNATEMEMAPLWIKTPGAEEVAVINQAEVIDALDNGHTIQVNARTGDRMTVDGKSYGLVQFHFHAPSEHTMAGTRFPMEIHFVHQAEDGALAVLGVLIDAGAENPGIDSLWTQLDAATGTEIAVRLPGHFADYVLPDAAGGVYHYTGSLTTPPCSENVMWYVLREPIELSREQIAAFTAVYDHNNRPVQPLNDREIGLDLSPEVTVE